MAKTLQQSLAAVLVSTAVALAAPVYAAGKTHEGTKTVHMKHSSKSNLAAVDRNERRITAELNRASLRGNL
jgi:hypothetical protein